MTCRYCGNPMRVVGTVSIGSQTVEVTYCPISKHVGSSVEMRHWPTRGDGWERQWRLYVEEGLIEAERLRRFLDGGHDVEMGVDVNTIGG